jgi:hypothetical protein
MTRLARATDLIWVTVASTVDPRLDPYDDAWRDATPRGPTICL